MLDARNVNIPDHWTKLRSIDFGFSHPFVCQWWALDEQNIMYLYREIYMTRRHIELHAESINKYSEGESYVATVADGNDTANIDVLRRHGIFCQLADKEKEYGMQLMLERLRVFPDAVRQEEKTNMYFLNNALVETDGELAQKFHPHTTFQSLINLMFKDNQTGSRNEEEPVKRHDDGYDATRYAVVAIDGHLISGREVHTETVNVATGYEPNRKRARRDRVKDRGRSKMRGR